MNTRERLGVTLLVVGWIGLLAVVVMVAACAGKGLVEVRGSGSGDAKGTRPSARFAVIRSDG
jgi:hypothetical protein